MKQIRIAVLVSGGGTNLQALIDAEKTGRLSHGTLAFVVSDKEDAYALTRAKEAGIPTAVISKKAFEREEDFDGELIRALRAQKIDLIVLAGYLVILSERVTSAFPDRIINVHPALIPAFCGKGFYGIRVHEAVLAAGVKVTGATVHYVNAIPDGGKIIAQKAVSVLPDDTPRSLQLRVMQEAEWQILPEAVEKISRELSGANGITAPDVYKVDGIGDLIRGNSYVGRGLVIGKSEDGKKAVCAYFIMGRSANSRNRVFTEKSGEVFTEPFDASKVEDPSLIIYAAIRRFGDHLIVTNGDQTDTVYDGLAAGKTFSAALATREFEPDSPNFTPRISGVIHFSEGDFTYEMNILKSADAAGSACNRFTYDYAPLPGVGHFLHTYICDGTPIPTFRGEPERIAIPNEIDRFTEDLWEALDADNKISLYVRYIDLGTGREENRLINKNK